MRRITQFIITTQSLLSDYNILFSEFFYSLFLCSPSLSFIISCDFFFFFLYSCILIHVYDSLAHSSILPCAHFTNIITLRTLSERGKRIKEMQTQLIQIYVQIYIHSVRFFLSLSIICCSIFFYIGFPCLTVEPVIFIHALALFYFLSVFFFSSFFHFNFASQFFFYCHSNLYRFQTLKAYHYII